MLRSTIIVILTLLVGCSITPNISPTADDTVVIDIPKKDTKVVNKPNFLLEQPTPLDITTYGELDKDNEALQAYADDLNWWFRHMFGYIKVVNDYSKSKGWRPPSEPPFCVLLEHDNIKELPKFTAPTEDSENEGDFEWSMVLYIKELQSLYNEHVDKTTENKKNQRLLCIY